MEYAMESFFGPTWGPFLLLALTLLMTMFCEVLRFHCFLSLGLGIPGRGGHRYTYYVDYSLTLPLIFPLLAMALTIISTRLWRQLLVLRPPLNLYIGGAFLVGLFCLIAFLLYKALGKVMNLREMAKMLVLLSAAEVFCFVCQPLRFVFGGTFFFLLTLAFGQTLRFSSWDDLVEWLHRAEDEAEGSAARDSVRVRIFLEAEGELSRRGERIEVRGEELAEGNDDPVASLSRRLLDRTRLTEIVAAQERLHRRQDLLDEVPAVIARNLVNLAGRREALSLCGGPHEEQLEKLKEAVREVLDQELRPWMRSLLYWNYGLPREEVQLCLTRTPRADLKPIVTFEQYLGIPLVCYARRRRARAKR